MASSGAAAAAALPAADADTLADTVDTGDIYGTALQPDSMPEPPTPAEWKREDFFSMTPQEELRLKTQLASKLGIRYGNCNQSKSFAEPFSGVEAYSVDGMKAGQERYSQALRAAAALGNDPAPDTKASVSTQLTDASNKALVVSGCLIRWKPLVAVNESYVIHWQKENVRQWDSGLERRAAPSADDLPYMHFSTTGRSSLLALICEVVYEYKTQKQVSPFLATAFKRIRLNVCFNATGDEIEMLGQVDNIEQSKRKKHTEMDNILAVLSWTESMRGWSTQLKGTSCLDVVRFACCLSDLRRSEPEPWMLGLLGGKPNTMKNRVAAIASSSVTKRWLSQNKATLPHPQMSSYDAVSMRFRFIRGFGPAQELYKCVFGRMAEMGHAHGASPFPKAVLMDPAILTSAAFTSQKEQDEVPAWRDGAAGAALQLRMVSVASERYVKHGFCDSEARRQ